MIASRIIGHFLAHHAPDPRNSLIWRVLTNRNCWNDELMLVCLDDMSKCPDVQVLESLISKQWGIVSKHVALLFDILMKTEQADAFKLIEKLGKHRECDELVPIFTRMLLRCFTQPGGIKPELSHLLGFLRQHIPRTGKKRSHGASFIDRALRLAHVVNGRT